jgi:hypothetical protein
MGYFTEAWGFFKQNAAVHIGVMVFWGVVRTLLPDKLDKPYYALILLALLTLLTLLTLLIV